MGRRPPRNHPAAVKAEVAPVDLEALHAKIGQLTLESDLSGGRAHQGGMAERKAMIDREAGWPIKRQAQLLGIAEAWCTNRPRRSPRPIWR